MESNDFEILSETRYADHTIVKTIMETENVDTVTAMKKGARRLLHDVLVDGSTYDQFMCHYRGSVEGLKGSYVKFLNVIKENEDVVLLNGVLYYNGTETNVVCKYYYNRFRSIDYEIKIYKRLRNSVCTRHAGAPCPSGCDHFCPVPWFSSDYKFLDQSILVMQELSPADNCEEWLRLGTDVLMQLRYLHQFGVHCDLKPPNIMMIEGTRIVDAPIKYHIIDFGGCAIEPISDSYGVGYRRFVSNKGFTSQPPQKDRIRVCTPYHDFLELGYVMAYLEIQYRKRNGQQTGNDHREHFYGKVKKYMSIVKSLNPYSIPASIYDELIRALN